MSTKLMVAFIVVCVYGGLITFGYIEERHKNKKKSRAPAGTRNAAHENNCIYFKPKQEVCQMDDKELIVYLSKKVAELEKALDLAEKESLYFFNKYKELENEQKQ